LVPTEKNVASALESICEPQLGQVWHSNRSQLPTDERQHMKDVENLQRESRIVIGTDKVCQGVTGHSDRHVLVFSMIGAVLALATTAVRIGVHSN
jgi:hypothetical protein